MTAANLSPHAMTMRSSSLWRSYGRELSAALAYAVMLAVLAIARPTFFSGGQFWETAVASAPLLVMAVGMTLVILAREIDISVGSMFSVCAICAGVAAKVGLPMAAVAGIAVGAGAVMGAINGVLVAGMGLPSIVVTLATMVVFRESLRWVREGASVQNLPASFQWFGLSQVSGQWVLVSVAVAIFLAFAWGCRYLAAGRAAYAVGSDAEAARLAGIRPKRVLFVTFVLMGAMTGLAALLQAVRFAEVDPNAGLGLELAVIAAVVVGGTAITGGRGTMVGTLVGVMLLGSVGAALGFLSDQAQWDKAIQGVIILGAVASDRLYMRGGS